jgi:hypothetical protein
VRGTSKHRRRKYRLFLSGDLDREIAAELRAPELIRMLGRIETRLRVYRSSMLILNFEPLVLLAVPHVIDPAVELDGSEVL